MVKSEKRKNFQIDVVKKDYQWGGRSKAMEKTPSFEIICNTIISTKELKG